MDLFEALTPKPSRLEIKHPVSGEGTGLFLDLVSASDHRVKAAERAYIDECRASGGKPEQDALARRKAAAAVVGFEFTGEASWKGKKPQFSEAIRDELMQVEKVYEQVIIHMVDDRNFFPT